MTTRNSPSKLICKLKRRAQVLAEPPGLALFDADADAGNGGSRTATNKARTLN